MIETLQRKSNDYLTAVQIRQLLKSNLGINARMASVAVQSSLRYVVITIRDPLVDVAKVQEFAKSLDTWSMDNSDYCTGQSVSVDTTREVDAIHAAPFLQTIRETLPKVAMNQGQSLSNKCILWLDNQGYYVTNEDGSKRMSYVFEYEARTGVDWAIQALALKAARLNNK